MVGRGSYETQSSLVIIILLVNDAKKEFIIDEPLYFPYIVNYKMAEIRHGITCLMITHL